MRIWNGLAINDRVIYQGNTCVVTKLYEENDQRLCDLMVIGNESREITRVLVSECTRCEE